MNRIKDYANFATWFAGLGYIVLWPVTSPASGDKSFGASVFCRDGSLSVLDLPCNSGQLLELPPGLHALGFLSAAFVAIRLLFLAARRWRCSAGAEPANTPKMPIDRIQIAMPRSPKRKVPPRPPLRLVKPRDHFGLRGMPH